MGCDSRPYSVPPIPFLTSPLKGEEFGIGVINLLHGSETGYSVNGVIETDTRFGTLKLPFDRKGNTRISG